MAICEDLHLDMVCRRDEFLHVAFAVAEGALCLGMCLLEGSGSIFWLEHLPDATSATTCPCLHKHRAADAPGLLFCLRRRLEQVAAWHDGNASRSRCAACLILVSHELHDLRRRPDEDKAMLAALAGK